MVFFQIKSKVRPVGPPREVGLPAVSTGLPHGKGMPTDTLSRIPLLIGCVATWVVWQNGAAAQDVEQLTAIVNSKICPSDLSTYSIVNANERCDPDQRNTKLCDRQYSPGSKEWSACYQEVFKCHRDVHEINKKIYAYNMPLSISAARLIPKDRSGKLRRPHQDAAVRPQAALPQGGTHVRSRRKRKEQRMPEKRRATL
jgi:hypothetical protein